MSDQMGNPTSTTFAGDSNPHAARNFMWGVMGLFTILFPVATITAVIVFFLFSFVRISPKLLAGFVAFYGLALVVIGQFMNSIMLYLESFSIIATSIMNGDGGSVFMQAFVHQAPFSLLLGGVIGVVASAWRKFRSPIWIEYKFRRTPLELYRKWKNIQNIRNDKRTPSNGRTLGINEDGERINQTHKELAAHTLALGGAGTGKTTTMLLGARDHIKRGEGLVFVDMKGSADVPVILAEYAKRYNRPFFHWTSQNPHTDYLGPMEDGPAFYDPLGRGDPTRKTDLLMAGRDWSEDFFKLIIKSYLLTAFNIAEGAPSKDLTLDTFAEAVQLLDPQTLRTRSLELVGDKRYEPFVKEIMQITDRKLEANTLTTLGSMRQQISILRNSIQGQWLRKDLEGKRDINLYEAAHKGAVIVFTIDSATYEENAQLLGNLIIQDLKTVAGELMINKSRFPLNVLIDEFSAIGSDNIATLLARSREAGVPVTLSTQSLGDLKVVSDAFLDQLTGIVASFIVHRPNSYQHAEIYAGFAGKVKKHVHRENVETRNSIFGGIGVGAGVGKGTIEVIEDYAISPSDIQNLKEGEMYFISKAGGRNERVRVIMEGKMSVSNKNDNATKKEDLDWKAEGDDYVNTFTSEDSDKYTIDQSINASRFDKEQREWNPHYDQDLPTAKSNPDNLARIFNRQNLENTGQENNRPIILQENNHIDAPNYDEYPPDDNEYPFYDETPEPQNTIPPQFRKAPALPIRSNTNAAPALPQSRQVSAPPLPAIKRQETVERSVERPVRNIQTSVRPEAQQPSLPRPNVQTPTIPTVRRSNLPEQPTRPMNGSSSPSLPPRMAKPSPIQPEAPKKQSPTTKSSDSSVGEWD